VEHARRAGGVADPYARFIHGLRLAYASRAKTYARTGFAPDPASRRMPRS
jgi:hypothetical protein